MLATLSQIVLAALIVIISIGGYQFYQRYKQNVISRKPTAKLQTATQQTTPDPVNKTHEHKESENINENQDCFNSNIPRTNLYLQIATVNWEQICAFAHTDTLICLTMICKELYQLINQSEYLAHQTLLSIIQNNIDIINLMYEHCILDDIDDVDLNTETNPVTLPLFTPHIFKRMSLFPNTKLFQCYSRLMSYNWRLHYNVDHNSYLQLAKVHNKLTSLQFKSRNLNICEIKLFAMANKPFNKGLENKTITFEVKTNDTIQNIKSTIQNKAGIAPKKQCLIVGGKGKKLKGSDIGKDAMLHFNYKNLFIATPTKYKFIINDFNSFIGNLQKFCYYDEWKDIIFDLDFFLAGGMVLKCLLKYYSDPNESMKDLDFFACNMRFNTFQTRVDTIKLKLITNGFTVIESCSVEDNYGGSHIKNLYVNFSTLKTNALMYEKDINLKNKLIQWEYNKKCIEKEGFWTDFQFIHISKGFKPWSILHIFDLDCCQVGFNGNEVLSTYAFIQSINTQTMINYKTINKPRLYDIWMKRTIKYAQRGFQFIVNHKFNVNEERNPDCKFVITWDNFRQNALEKCFSFDQNSDMKTAFQIHSNGGFGLNNDSFGVRKQFIYDGIIGGKCVVLQIPL